ncbi:hypothetical protein C9374_005264 [Naegleria lovaniensis]|uniref:Metallo-beta-lactamase domain-containing protein n=1 Tax=Naegleria lovaniensis TaxID=51637 RepID=A0AA88KIC8_NAELO|nr:uncharacterized protein C9374_005264 [Naegleria lovaniensis]KAG2382684.1 hypothetical protein C9374_005264 [Naegleria lovaniensis]
MHFTRHVRAIGGATFVFEQQQSNSASLDVSQSIAIGCDPVLCPKDHVQDYGIFKTQRLQAPSLLSESDLEHVDIWLLTHGHDDHLDEFGLEKILKGKQSSIIVAHPGVEKLLTKALKQTSTSFGDRQVHWLSPQQEVEFEDLNGFHVKIRAVHAFHGKSKFFGSILPRGNGNGYLVELKEVYGKNSHTPSSSNQDVITSSNSSTRFYVTGDHVFNEENILQDTNELFSAPLDFIITNGGEATVERIPYGIGSLLHLVMGPITNGETHIRAMHERIRPKQTFVVHHGTFQHYPQTYTRETFEVSSGIKVLFAGDDVEV